MKLVHFITLITCFFGALNASEVFKRTNCISNGGEICGGWDSLCCEGVSIELPDAYDCWILWPFVKSKIRVCGKEPKKTKSKDTNTCACQPTTTLSPVTTSAIEPTSVATTETQNTETQNKESQ
eukprot:jgi/Orpsp1_1/1192381/evm.model.d7180000092793.1